MTEPRLHLYSIYERLWHWLQALGILLLVATGLAIHWPDRLGWLPFSPAVRLHNLLGLFLVANAALGFFYYVTTGTIRQYLPERRNFVSLAVRQAMFYLGGIFRGEAHPLEKSPERRLNPLQQIAYLAVLNVLLSIQILTGLAIWGAERWPGAAASLGGLPVLATVHTLGAWLFGSFLVMHLYLITTGRTPLANVRAMILGYEQGETVRAPK